MTNILRIFFKTYGWLIFIVMLFYSMTIGSDPVVLDYALVNLSNTETKATIIGGKYLGSLDAGDYYLDESQILNLEYMVNDKKYTYDLYSGSSAFAIDLSNYFDENGNITKGDKISIKYSVCFPSVIIPAFYKPDNKSIWAFIMLMGIILLMLYLGSL